MTRTPDQPLSFAPAPAAHLRLGVNIDHVATIRNARGGRHPDPLRAAHLAVAAGADGITAHLREDRRHISDPDIARLKQELTLPLNLEMASTEEMLAIALRHVPHACCLVPEKREERTTEGGLNVESGSNHLRRTVDALKAAGIRVSLFIEPEPGAVAAAARLSADIVELHTGAYCEAHSRMTRPACGTNWSGCSAPPSRRPRRASKCTRAMASPSIRWPPSPACRSWWNSTSATSWWVRRFSAGSARRFAACAL